MRGKLRAAVCVRRAVFFSDAAEGGRESGATTATGSRLFIAESDYGVNAEGAAGWDVTREERYGYEDDGNDGEG
jgi:hypothetical protein